MIPTVHLERPDAVPVIKHACTQVGFFYLEGHGIESDLVERVFDASQRLFALPDEEKQRLSDKQLSRGYTAMGAESLDPATQKTGDTKEGYYIGRDIAKSDPLYDPLKLRGPNQWPREDLVPNFRSVMEEYHEKMTKLAYRVVQLLAQTLGLEKDYFQPFFEQAVDSLRLLHYSKQKSKPEEGIFGCGAHSDYGMITLLLTDEHEGLQIYHQGQWMDVPPRPQAFVVNLGDMLARWTNDVMKSTVHRVLNNGEHERYSIPFFYDPSFEAIVACLEVCVDEEHPAKYPPTVYGEHIVGKYHKTRSDFSPYDDTVPS